MTGITRVSRRVERATQVLVAWVVFGEGTMTQARWNNVIAPALLPLVSMPLGPMIYCMVSATRGRD